MFEITKTYTKNDIYKILAVPEDIQRGAWDTGYREYNGAIYLFINVGIPGRTGHDYSNYWIGNTLHWQARTDSHINQPSMLKILSDDYVKYIFTRTDDKSPFTYEGTGVPNEVKDLTPVEIVWDFGHSADNRDDNQVEVLNTKHFEGARQTITVNAYERNPYARRECITHFGYKCSICGFDYERFYGSIGKNYIHVHHKVPISQIGDNYLIDPIKDLIPVCANCHSIIHRKKDPLKPDELKQIIEG